jgi:protein tyrosine phosphatase (PTP) superfamily phosphohydrolase (DUF442 family)
MPIKLFESLHHFEDKLRTKVETTVSDLQKVESKIEHQLEIGAKDAKDDLFDGAAIAVGYTELAGLRYPVKKYQLKVSDTLSRGARLDAADYPRLKNEGFKTLVDLTAEGTNDEKYGKANGLNVVQIPVIDNSHPTNAQVKQFLDVVTNPANQPAYVHCEAGKGRTGIFTACYRMAVEGWDLNKTMQEAQSLGMGLPNQIKFVTDFSAALKAGQIAGYPKV